MEQIKENNTLELISIFTCTKNRPNIILRAINSILEQTYKNIEYIIVDASTNDETERLIKNIQSDFIKYYRIYDEKNVHSTINYGLSLCNGKYIALQDDDDESVVDRIEKQYNFFLGCSETTGIVYCHERYIDDRTGKVLYERKPTLEGRIFYDLLEKGGGTGGGTQLMFKKVILEDVGGFVEEIDSPSDYLWYLKVSEKYEIRCIPEILIKTHLYHEYTNTITKLVNDRNYIQKSISTINYILAYYSNVFIQYPEKMYYHYKSLAILYCKLNKYNMFLFYTFQLFKIKPTKIENIKVLIRGILLIIGNTTNINNK